jgi:glutamate synthase domain-containing protein 3
MLRIDADSLDFPVLNEKIRQTDAKNIIVDNCLGQRYIGCASKDVTIEINGTPGNALGSYLNGAKLIVNGNAQDAVGDTMNEGEIIINGSAGDGIGLAQRGGEIYVRDSVGYRAGVHMKQYKEKLPVLTVGGSAGSFLGEYLAGGYIIVLGLNTEKCPISNFCAAGMHGGKIFIRGILPQRLPEKVEVKDAAEEDLALIMPFIDKYCEYFGASKEEIFSKPFHVLTPDSKNPYHQLYVFN